jgi:hypothetical protein
VKSFYSAAATNSLSRLITEGTHVGLLESLTKTVVKQNMLAPAQRILLLYLCCAG